MSVTTLEQDIIRLFQPRLKEHYSINQIASKLGKTYPYIYHTVKGLLERGVMVATPIGRSHLCTLNLKSDECVAILTLNEIEKRAKIVKKNSFLQAVLDGVWDMQKKIPVWSTLLVGEFVYVVVDDDSIDRVVDIVKGIPYANLEVLAISDLQDLLFRSEEMAFREDRILLQGFSNYFAILGSMEEHLRTLYSPLSPIQTTN